MEPSKRRKVVGWIAVVISSAFANLWAFWGIKENFHEGWYFESFWQNVVLMFGQYLLLPLGFAVLALIAIRWHKVGAVLHVLLAIGAFWLFGSRGAGFLMVALPLVGLALLYWFGGLEKRKLAYVLVFGLPLVQIFGFGSFDAWRVAHRYNDGNFSARVIEGNGVKLLWAPEGPGWPDNGTPWEDAGRICAHLDSSGTVLLDSAVHIWRLPTVDEAVRSQVFHGTNAGGVWDSVAKQATYANDPDKESPLWNMYRKTVYWWTSTSVSDREAYILVYNGGVYPRMKKLRAAYLNFRAVRDVR
jgi:hypothetical protein